MNILIYAGEKLVIEKFGIEKKKPKKKKTNNWNKNTRKQTKQMIRLKATNKAQENYLKKKTTKKKK